MSEKMLSIAANSPPALHVCGADPRMGRLIEAVGDLELPRRKDLFASLLRSIVGQQLSVHAANAVWGRLETVCETVTPANFVNLSDEDLRSAGLSRPKVKYARDLSQRVISREIVLSKIPDMQDEDIITTLTTVKGIGRWTVEMLLIFTLGRPDVFAVDDLGLRKALQWLYGLSELPGKQTMQQYGERWKPHRTVASLYLWQTINRKMVSAPCPFD